MIYSLVPIQTVFDKVISDLSIAMHEVDDRTWRRWAMEATEHIGALNRIKSLCCVTTHGENITSPIIDHKVELNYGVISVDEVRYYTKDFTDKYAFTKCIYANNKQMDDGSTDVYYDFEYINKTHIIACQLVLNRQEGFVVVIGAKRPFVFDDKGENANLYVPNIASYLEAVGFYIMWRISLRDFYKGKQIKQGAVQYFSGMWSNFRNKAYAELMLPATQEELDQLGAELGLGMTYTGMNPRFVSLHEDVKIPTFTTGEISKGKEKVIETQDDRNMRYLEEMDELMYDDNLW